MNEFTNPLNNVRIASPCKADWNQMIGDERRRFCGECSLNVYNLSAMTKAEAENLLVNSEGRLCARFYKRADGTVLTKDCPVGWQAIKRRASKMATAAASLIIGIFSGLGLSAYFNQPKQENLMGAMVPVPPAITGQPVEPLTDATTITPIREDAIQVGRVELDYPIVGGISNIDEVRKQVKKKRRR